MAVGHTTQPKPLWTCSHLLISSVWVMVDNVTSHLDDGIVQWDPLSRQVVSLALMFATAG